MNDIYAPPSSNVETDLPSSPRGASAKKPKAVLLLQFWAIALIGLLAVGLMKNIHNIDGRNYGVVFGMNGKTRIYLLIGIIVALMLHGLDRRSIVGRVLGIGAILLTAAPVYLQFLIAHREEAQPALLYRYIGILVFCLPFVYWGYAFSFSARARNYFAQAPD
jgi:4-hydroxybenzoate polyprenyltransferase